MNSEVERNPFHVHIERWGVEFWGWNPFFASHREMGGGEFWSCKTFLVSHREMRRWVATPSLLHTKRWCGEFWGCNPFLASHREMRRWILRLRPLPCFTQRNEAPTWNTLHHFYFQTYQEDFSIFFQLYTARKKIFVSRKLAQKPPGGFKTVNVFIHYHWDFLLLESFYK